MIFAFCLSPTQPLTLLSIYVLLKLDIKKEVKKLFSFRKITRKWNFCFTQRRFSTSAAIFSGQVCLQLRQEFS